MVFASVGWLDPLRAQTVGVTGALNPEALTMFSLMVFGTVFAWIFRRAGVFDVVGYVVGGATASLLLTYLGVDIGASLGYLEPLKWLGITLFFFNIGSSIGLHRILSSIRFVVASELIVYAIAWVCSGFLAGLLSFGYGERLAFFITLVNSSTAVVVALTKGRGVLGHIVDRVVIQTSAEDLAQFTLFTVMFTVGTATRIGFIAALKQVVIVVGLMLLLLFLGRALLGLLRRAPFVRDRENRFIVALGTAILFASTASALGLPPLFGAFIAGLSFSIHLPLGDTEDMISGLKNLGLLLYFTSLGAELISAPNSGIEPIAVGVFLGVVLYLVRFLALLVAMLITEGSMLRSLLLALNLSPLSESSLVLIDTLMRSGLVTINTLRVLTIAVALTIVVFGILSPRLSPRVGVIERLFPEKIAAFLRGVGAVYMERVDLVIEMMKPLTVFTAVALAIASLNHITIGAASIFGIQIGVSIAVALISSATLIALYIYTLRRMLKHILRDIGTGVTKPVRAFTTLMNIVVGAVAIAVQLSILYEVIQSIVENRELLTLTTALIGVAFISTTVYEIAKYHTKISKQYSA